MDVVQQEIDRSFRELAFAWLDEKTEEGSRPLLRDEIKTFKNHVPEARHHLILQQGIWAPADLLGTLSVTTGAKDGRKGRNVYTDRLTDTGLVEYAFTEAPTKQHENEGLRRAYARELPIIYFRALRPGLYDAYYPVYIREIDEERRTALLDLSEPDHLVGADMGFEPIPVSTPAYGRQIVKRRLHQRDFRSNVMHAYSTRCAICALKHSKLLDAAHIVADSKGGSAHVSNGLSLCKLHHGAFDAKILGVTPDYTVQVRADVLDERNGPMLTHGIQAHHGQKLLALPTAEDENPSRLYLEQAYAEFKEREAAQ